VGDETEYALRAMSVWDSYPSDYRADEVRAITAATHAGECVSVVGLSGAGKSNLLGFLAGRQSTAEHAFVLVDCNRLDEPSPAAIFRLIRRALADSPLLQGDVSPEAKRSGEGVRGELDALDAALEGRLQDAGSSLSLALDVSLLFSRFDDLARDPAFSGNLRALRDAHKYRLTFVTATRHPLLPHTELSELFYANTLWLGSLNKSDARWNVARYAERKGLKWDDAISKSLISVSRGYPSLLRAVCEAYADGASPDVNGLSLHPAVRARVEEFWADKPSEDEMRRSGLENLPLLQSSRPLKARTRFDAPTFDTSHLTAKENLLLSYFLAHSEVVCEKDDLIRAVWPEDKVFERGVRDDSLAQLIRRLREKIEPDPANPRYIHTVPGRGYRFTRE
jgi:energy-coupling factor transporter ATP-binding protein EcfA2